MWYCLRITHILALATLLHATSAISWPSPEELSTKCGGSYDFVVVGGGTAGCIVASRLSEDPEVSVLVLEAGGLPPPESDIPGEFVKLQNTEVDWSIHANVPGDGLQCRRNPHQLRVSGGKMLGGSSSINNMFYARGAQCDYNMWAKLTKDASWNTENILPYYKKSERLTDETLLRSSYGKYFGDQGPLGVSNIPSNTTTKYLNAFEEAGYNKLLQCNSLDGAFGVSEGLSSIADNLRQSTAYAYLHEAFNRSNLDVVIHARVTKVLINANKVARGVEYLDKNNKTCRVRATKEVIVSGGPFFSPQILMLSGIGPKEHLKELGIKVVADLPVGVNLRNQQEMILIYKTEPLDRSALPPISSSVTGYIAVDKTQACPDYMITAFVIDSDIMKQLMVLKYEFSDEAVDTLYNETQGKELLIAVLTHITQKPRGSVTLKSKNPLDYPNVTFVSYVDDQDFETILDYMEDLNRILNTTYFDNVQGELVTMPNCREFDKNSRDYLRCYALCAGNAPNHQVGTCMMGSSDDPTAVLDSRLRVRGVRRLRVVDSSIMPRLPSGNTNAPTMMIGEKGADMIKEDHKLGVYIGESVRTNILLH